MATTSRAVPNDLRCEPGEHGNRSLTTKTFVITIFSRGIYSGSLAIFECHDTQVAGNGFSLQVIEAIWKFTTFAFITDVVEV